MPLGFDVSTGFIVDAYGTQSRQQDIVLVRRDYHPIFRIGGVNFFTAESVAATVEVKSALTNATLRDALDNVRSVKALDRTAGGSNYVIAGGAAGGLRGQQVDQDIHEHQILSLIVPGSTTMQPVSAVETHWVENGAMPRRQWPNLICVADSWALSYYTHIEQMHAVDPMEASHFGVTFGPSWDDPEVSSHTLPLVELAWVLWDFLRVSPLIDVAPSRYVGRAEFASRRIAIEPGNRDDLDRPPGPARK